LTRSWDVEQKRLNIAHLQHTKPFMPPFAGSAPELEALVQMLSWAAADEPRDWPLSESPQTLERVERWLAEAGTAPGIAASTPGRRDGRR
jgi:hypothetical protein